jgi:hypothetical protein
MQPELRKFLRWILWITFIAALIGGGRRLEDPGLSVLGSALLYMTVAAAVLRPIFNMITREPQ